MFHPEVLEQIKQEKMRGGFIYPFYGMYSIAELAPTIHSLFGIPVSRPTLPSNFFNNYSQKYQKIITFIIDGFGYNHFTEYHKNLSFFDKLQDRGEVYPLTSVFPSTTPAALTSIYTGLTPQEHGLPEWTVYFEEFDAIIEPLLFRKQKSHKRDSLITQGGKAEMLFWGDTIFTQLAQSAIPSHNFMYRDYATSSYSSMVATGSEVQTFGSGSELMSKLRATIQTTPGSTYFFVYWSFIDSAQHAYGPSSIQHTHALAEFSDLIENELLQKIQPADVANTLLLLSADHGQTSIRGEDILYLDKYVYLNEAYSNGKNGQSILPTGAPHDVFLFIDPSKLEETLRLLKKDLEGKAEVLTTAEAISRGLFGINIPSQRFLNRIGNILILPYPGIHIWYEHFPAKTFLQLGTHGGLSENEMIVPLAIAELKNLLD
jgi:predicted AlkP superfamily pyrophosphatase or phosphodiesterase